jgi:hypothetical protein
MTEEFTLRAAGNVVVPAILALREKGYQVSRAIVSPEEREFWYAEKPDQHFTAEDPIMLLGLVALYEMRGTEWRAPDEEIDRFFLEFYPDP